MALCAGGIGGAGKTIINFAEICLASIAGKGVSSGALFAGVKGSTALGTVQDRTPLSAGEQVFLKEVPWGTFRTVFS